VCRGEFEKMLLGKTEGIDSGLLTFNLEMAMDYVDTKYMLVIQHNLRFIHDVNYTALIRSTEENQDNLIFTFAPQSEDVSWIFF